MLAPTRIAQSLTLLVLCTAAAAASAADCSLTIVAITDRGTYQLGEPIQVQLQVSNSGTALCAKALQPQVVALDILDADGRKIASSRQEISAPPGDTLLLDLAPGESMDLVSIPWAQGPGQFPNTAAAADGQGRSVGPGAFRLRATWIGAETSRAIESVPFEISQRPFQAHVPVMSPFGASLLASLLALAMWVVMRPASAV